MQPRDSYMPSFLAVWIIMIITVLCFTVYRNETSKLQRIQNVAEHILTFTRKRDHIRPILMSLHWLLVEARIVFKILNIVYKCLYGSAPSYHVELLETYNPVRELRSASQLLLAVRKSRTKKAGDRSFYVCAPKLYHDPPL